MVRKIENKTKRMLQVEDEYGIEIEELLRWAYVDQGYTASEIGIYCGVRRETAQDWLKRAGITRRKVVLVES